MLLHSIAIDISTRPSKLKVEGGPGQSSTKFAVRLQYLNGSGHEEQSMISTFQ
jgi:hypothetical protein